MLLFPPLLGLLACAESRVGPQQSAAAAAAQALAVFGVISYSTHYIY